MMVGSLIYASISTRPDITHAVGIVSRHMSNPTAANMTQVKRIYRYLSWNSFTWSHLHTTIIIMSMQSHWSDTVMLIGRAMLQIESRQADIVQWWTTIWSAGSRRSNRLLHTHRQKPSTWHRQKLRRRSCGCDRYWLNSTLLFVTPTIIYVDNNQQSNHSKRHASRSNSNTSTSYIITFAIWWKTKSSSQSGYRLTINSQTSSPNHSHHNHSSNCRDKLTNSSHWKLLIFAITCVWLVN